MQVRKFEASSLDEALGLVKQSLGPNALILSSQQRRQRWFNKECVEVTAAFEPPKESPVRSLEQVFDEQSLYEIFPHRRGRYGNKRLGDQPEPSRKVERTSGVSKGHGANDARGVKGDDLTQRPEQFDSAVSGHHRSPRYIDIPGNRKRSTHATRIEDRFLGLGLSANLAKDLANQLVFDYPQKDLAVSPMLEKAMARLLAERIRCAGQETVWSGGDWVPIGLSGSGRTTFLVKLALLARSRGRSASLVSLDSSRLMAREALQNYSRLIHIPFYSEKNYLRSKEANKFIDCPSLPIGGSLDDWERFERCVDKKRSFLVLDATMRLKEAERLLEQVSRFSPVGVVVTKVDLAMELGPIFEFLRASKLPLMAISHSQGFKVPIRFLDEKEFGLLIIRQGVFE